MASQVLPVVTAQQALLTGYATSALASAQAAIAVLSDFEVGDPTESGITFGSINAFSPSQASRPGGINIGRAPAIAEIQIPDAPDKPDTPKISTAEIKLGDMIEITLPDLPEIELPFLELTAPEYTIPAPVSWSFDVGDVLISDDPMIQAALARLTSNIANGGTGLSSTVEEAIWDRDRERMEQQLSDSTDKATAMWAKKGFSLPDGLLAHSLSELQKEYMNKNIDRSREIAVEQAKLEQSNLFKSLELAFNLASKLIENLIRYEDLVFRSQEATAKFANEYIDIQIRTYASLVEAYKATAQTYEIIIRAELAKIEVYKAQIDGQRLIGTVNEQTLKIYSDTIAATRIIIDKYRAEVEAYSAVLGAEKTKIEANKVSMDAWAEGARARVAAYNGEVEMFRAESQFNVSSAELRTKSAEANLRAITEASALQAKIYEGRDRTIMLAAQVKMEGAKGAASAAASLAAGAMAAVHATASIGYSESQALEFLPA
jgi:hypothetical protein